MADPLVSFIIAAYNEEKYIEECIESCLRQTYNNVEVVITNDGSTDKTAEVIKSRYQNNNKVRLLSFESNRGKVAAFNNSFENSAGQYVAIIGADDINYPDRIELSLKYAKEHEFVCGDLDQTNENNSVFLRKRIVGILFGIDNTSEISFEELVEKPKVFGGTVFIKRTLADKIFPLDLSLTHEDWWIPLMASFYSKVLYVNSPFIKYRIHSRNTWGDAVMNKMSFDRWVRLFTRDLAYYCLLKEFIINKGKYGKFIGFLDSKILLLRIFQSRSLFERIGFFVKIKHKNIFKMLENMFYAINPKLLFYKTQCGFIVRKLLMTGFA